MLILQNRYLHTLALAIAAALVTWLALASLVAAKGPVDMITIEGEELNGAIEITNAASLYSFDPWFRQFIDWKQRRIKIPPTVKDTYEVSFHLNERGKIFVLQYFTDLSGGPGYIYIPGPGEPGYRLNIATIITGDSDSWNPNGQWQHATPAWGMLMQRSIEKATSVPTASNGSSNTLAWALALGTLVLVSTAALASLRLRRKPA